MAVEEPLAVPAFLRVKAVFEIFELSVIVKAVALPELIVLEPVVREPA